MQKTNNISKRGFASFSPQKRREVAQRGGRNAHAMGVAHTWTIETARIAAQKSAEARNSKREEVGKEGMEEDSCL